MSRKPKCIIITGQPGSGKTTLAKSLGGVRGDVTVEVGEIDGEVTSRSILDALETQYPMLRGTIREHVSGERRPFLRFFACGEDVTHTSPTLLCLRRSRREQKSFTSLAQSRAVDSLNCFSGILHSEKLDEW